MNIKDVMLDIATGDSTTTDAYVEHAVGKINLSNAVYALESKIAEGEFEGCIQEAADAGYETDPTKAEAVSCEAVRKELDAFYDVIVGTAKSTKEVLGKSTKLAVGIGKNLGVDPTGNVEEFARKVAAQLLNGDKKFVLAENTKCLKGKYALKMADAYVNGVTKLISAYGIPVGEESGKDVNDFKELSKRLDFGGRLVKFGKIVSKDRHYVDAVKERDIVDCIVALYRIYQFAGDVFTAAGSKSAKKTAIEGMSSLWKSECDGKKITRAIESINDDIKEWTNELTTTVESIKTGLGDSFYAVVETLSNAK